LAEAAAALFGRRPTPVHQANFLLDSAYQGNEALNLVQRALAEGRPYAVAFVDVRMPPGWDGIETIERLWAIDPDLQIVICTAYADYSWEDLAHRLGESDSVVILKKPFDNIEVLQLADALAKKWLLTRQLRQRVADLDQRVQERGQQLRLQGAALESAANSILITDRDGVILWHNAAFTQLTGYTEQETIGQKPSLLKSGRHDPELYHGLWHTIRSGQVWHGELVNRRKDGRLYTEEMTITPVRGADGNISHYVAIKQDITERKQAELRLSAFSTLGQRLSSAQTAKAAAQIIVEVADQLLGWDACVCDLYSAHEQLVQPVLAIDIVSGQRTECDPDHPRQAPGELARRAIQEGGQLLLRDDPRGMRPDGMPFGDVNRPSASILYVPIRNGTNVIGLLSIQSYSANAYNQQNLQTLQLLADHCGAALDRIRTEEALRRAQERLNRLLNQSAAMIYSLKPNGRATTFSWISDNVTDLLGFSPGEACQPAWLVEHLHPEDREKVLSAEAQLFAANHRVTEFRFRHKDGGYRWLRDDQRLVRGSNGDPAEVVGTWLDVTERKELEQQLRHSQKMEAIGQLAGGVAHDFNNMLTVIRGHTELLLMEPRQFTPQTEDCLKQVVAAADRATNLTRQLLAFSRKQVLQSRPLDLDDVIGNLTKMLKRIIGEDIQFQCSHGAGVPMVQADAGMIEQVVINLVFNARDAMPHGGQLEIKTEKATIPQSYARWHPEAHAGDFACLTVSDTGCGIAPENIPRIFEPFFTTKEIGKGTGLGLATVYGIVKQHRGWVEVSSQINAGSTFKVFLPAIDPAPAIADGAQISTRPPRGKETILLVEDDEAVRSLTRRLLETFGYKVHEAGTGVEALERWKSQLSSIDLLLTDMVMPGGLTGRDLAERLRVLSPRIKVVFLSGYSGEALGADTNFIQRIHARFLQKPCSWRTLLQEVRRSLDE
jgi:PAS domain S-box-containing protein